MPKSKPKYYSVCNISDRGNRHDGDHYMYLCRVIIRDPYIAVNPMTEFGRPPCIQDGCKNEKCTKSHEFHDSVIGISAKGGAPRLLYREFIVYDLAQCYPEFLIKYERVA